MSDREQLRLRAWDTVEEKMIHNLEEHCGLKADLACCNHIIMQFITTEGSQEIFEDDIIQETVHGKVIRTFVAHNIRTFTREYDKAHHAAIWEVIGDIHNNPELKDSPQ